MSLTLAERLRWSLWDVLSWKHANGKTGGWFTRIFYIPCVDTTALRIRLPWVPRGAAVPALCQRSDLHVHFFSHSHIQTALCTISSRLYSHPLVTSNESNVGTYTTAKQSKEKKRTDKCPPLSLFARKVSLNSVWSRNQPDPISQRACTFCGRSFRISPLF